MRVTEYHINSIDADLNTNIGEAEFTRPTISLRVGEGIYDEENDSLTTDLTLVVDFHSDEDRESDEELGDPEYGSAEFEIDVFIGSISDHTSDELDISSEMETWESNGYEYVSEEIVALIESGIVSEIMSPLDRLLDNSYFGILPMYRFSQVPEEKKEDGDSEGQTSANSS